MEEDHDRIEELAAGYVLLGISGEDATMAHRLLSEHVPSCPLCRDTMAGFQAVVGELGLATSPARPPDLLLPRIRRSAEQVPVRRRRRASLAAVTAGVAALMSLGAFSMSLGSRMSRAETHVEQLLEVIQPGVTPVSIVSQGQPAATPMVEVSRPELERMYVIGQGVPKPAGGLLYQLWLGSSGNFVPVRQFVPEDGLVLLVFTVDTTRFDEILITEEPSGEATTVPSSTGHRWHAFLELARPLDSAILDVEPTPEGPEMVCGSGPSKADAKPDPAIEILAAAGVRPILHRTQEPVARRIEVMAPFRQSQDTDRRPPGRASRPRCRATGTAGT